MKIKREISLKNRVSLFIGLLIFTIGSLATYVVFLYTKKIMIEKEKDGLQIVTTEVANELSQIMNNSSAIVEGIANNDFIVDNLKGNETGFRNEHILKHLEQYNIGDAYSAIYIMLPDGITLVSTEESFVGKNYGFRSYFTTAMSGQPAIDVAIGATSKKFGYYFSHPIKDDNNKIIGVVVAKMKPEFIHDNASLNDRMSHSHIMLVEENGVIVFSDKEDRILHSLGKITEEDKKKIEESKRFQGIDVQPIQYDIVQKNLGLNKIQVFEFYDEVDGEEEILAFSRIENSPVFLVAELKTKEYTYSAIGIAYVMGLFVFFAALITIVFVYLLISKTLKPLGHFHDLVVKVGSGDLSVKIDNIGRGKEMVALSKVFNKMVENVKKSREEVNKKVLEQTSEIREKQAEMRDQQKALVNILEDVEAEKEKTQDLAKDLEKFKMAVDNASDHIVITDIDGIVLYANKAVKKITGFPISRVIGTKAGDENSWGGLMDDKFYKKMWKTIKDDKKVFSGEIVNRRKDGSKYDVFAAIAPVLNDEGEVVFFVGIERDITREKEIDRAKSEFVSLASHQLRTPLSAINWYTEMLMSGDAGKINNVQKEYLGEVYHGSKRMVELVNALLNVSRIELGTFAVEPEPTDLREVSRDVLKEMIVRIKERQMKIEEKYGKNLPKINVDPKLVRIVFQNFFSNSIKYTPEKGTVGIDISKKDKNILIKFYDTGFGIPKEQQPKIFSKLFRADNIKEKETDGTGLGLYIVKSIIDHSGGRIWFESKENKGTTFFIEIPLSGMKKKEGSKDLSEEGVT